TLLQNWKVKLNETAKSPCFFNVFPELNHNEMEGFGGDSADKFHFILFLDEADHSRTKKRMRIFENLFSARGFSFSKVEISGEARTEKILRVILLGEWMALFLAEKNGILNHDTPLIREFKEKLRE
ncbi:MAG: SIS domain-containing protein, partial [Patescibacteria group bacterium]